MTIKMEDTAYVECIRVINECLPLLDKEAKKDVQAITPLQSDHQEYSRYLGE